MVTGALHVNLFDLVAPVARAVDMMSPAVADHHRRVAYLAFRLAQEMPLPEQEACDLAIAGALHDVGAFSLHERLDALAFEDTQPGPHSLAGYLLLKEFPPFASLASYIRFHHIPWEHGAGQTQAGNPVPLGSHVLHLADRVVVQIAKGEALLGQVPRICENIEHRKGLIFEPELVDAMLRLAKRDYIWMEMHSDAVISLLRKETASRSQELGLDDLLEFARLLCRIIDFKSEFTATHSTGVAVTAVALARLTGFSEQECKLMQIAAFLHDLGKLAIPSEILEKPGRLTSDERNVMRTHAYFTYQVLEPISVLDMITSWGALHQERLDGSGYPFGYKAEELPLGARIMAVADVFTALTEDRPYRSGMEKEKAIGLIDSMVNGHELDGRLVRILLENFDEINARRAAAQQEAVREYEAFQAALQ